MGSMGLVAVDVEQVGKFCISPTHCNPTGERFPQNNLDRVTFLNLRFNPSDHLTFNPTNTPPCKRHGSRKLTSAD